MFSMALPEHRERYFWRLRGEVVPLLPIPMTRSAAVGEIATQMREQFNTVRERLPLTAIHRRT